MNESDYYEEVCRVSWGKMEKTKKEKAKRKKEIMRY